MFCQKKFCVLKTEGNYNNEIGLPLTVLRIQADCEIAVLEMGISNFGEMHRLSRIAKPDVCLITNIGQCHLENLGTRDGILRAKSEIFDFMQEGAGIFLNGDDDKLVTIRDIKGSIPVFLAAGARMLSMQTSMKTEDSMAAGRGSILTKQRFRWRYRFPGSICCMMHLLLQQLARFLD